MTDRDVSRYLRKGMTVAELIEELQAMDPHARVVFAYTANDYWSTKVARAVRTVDEATLSWSAYHRLPTPLDSDDADADGYDAVVLNLDAGDSE
jgi:hypothetical protein